MLNADDAPGIHGSTVLTFWSCGTAWQSMTPQSILGLTI
jgi:hypothetical protein